MLRRLDAAGLPFRTGSHGENRTARCDRASGFSPRGATAGRISSLLAGSQTHVGAGIGVCGIQDGGETDGSRLRLRSLAKKLEARLNTLDASRSWTASLRRNFFSRLLASNRK